MGVSLVHMETPRNEIQIVEGQICTLGLIRSLSGPENTRPKLNLEVVLQGSQAGVLANGPITEPSNLNGCIAQTQPRPLVLQPVQETVLEKGNPSRRGKTTKSEMSRSKKKGADLRNKAKHNRKKSQQKGVLFSNCLQKGAIFRAAAAAISLSVEHSINSRRRNKLLNEAQATIEVGKILGMCFVVDVGVCSPEVAYFAGFLVLLFFVFFDQRLVAISFSHSNLTLFFFSSVILLQFFFSSMIHLGIAISKFDFEYNSMIYLCGFGAFRLFLLESLWKMKSKEETRQKWIANCSVLEQVPSVHLNQLNLGAQVFGFTSEVLTKENIVEPMRDIRRALLEADVSLPVVRRFVQTVSEQAVGVGLICGVRLDQQLVKIVHDELVKLMGGEVSELVFAKSGPTIILLASLQGVGKTIVCTKFTFYLKKQGKSCMLVAGDVYKPAAIDQLVILGEQVDMPIYAAETGVKHAEIARQGLEEAKMKNIDVVIVDTAGRLQIDKTMMDELKKVKRALNPTEVLLVVDTMTGQEAAEWYRICELSDANDVACAHYVLQLQYSGLLKGDDLSNRHQAEVFDSKARAELLDIILKESFVHEGKGKDLLVEVRNGENGMEELCTLSTLGPNSMISPIVLPYSMSLVPLSQP
ncbi:hypothetical protein TEA_028165 [Camellia sinensis var. sinensis]|uniref:SRP54-type proteins GTP-binding domain-containing protein n=1 Tax=Camellia sinensis var. sinensis TaxID=542762 RepID=A0A4S4D9Z5_CAMSN|nr:hypothetical protein TEA_028165 [Camellia sinensis var. sinensis]